MQATMYSTVLPNKSPQDMTLHPNCCSPLSMKIAILAAIVLSGILIASALVLGGIISLALPVVALGAIILITALLILRLAICIKDIRWEHLPIELLEQELEKEIPSGLAFNTENNQDSLNKAESYALRYWSTHHYTAMNDVAAREKTGWRAIDSLFNMRIRCINRIAIHALSKLPSFANNQLLFRGANLSNSEIRKLHQVGKVFHLDRFMSTSAVKGAHFGEKNVIYQVHGKNGRSIKNYSAHPQEEEVLFAPGCKFYVSKITTSGTRTIIDMNEV